MKRMRWVGCAFGLALMTNAETPKERLWYRQPATVWTEALPIGNGQLGAMVFGGAPECRIQFNEATVWTGFPRLYAHTNAVAALPEIRRLLFAGQQKAAQDLAMRAFMSEPLHQEAFQPCGDLFVSVDGATNVTAYTRELDLSSAVHRVAYQTPSGATVTQETWASYPLKGVAFHRVATDRPGTLACTVRLSSPHRLTQTRAFSDGRLTLEGQVQSNGVAFAVLAVVRTEGRGARLDAGGDRLTVSGADAVEIRWTAATNVKAWNERGGDPAAACDATLKRVARKPYAALRDAHVKTYRVLFDRSDVCLPRTDASALPTDERLKAFHTANDPDFAALVFQYGRYLLISCSRPDGQPANLQGIWNDSLTPPWDSKYTCNINTEMNYWPAEETGLAECHEALFRALDELMISGRVTAREHYGARGWVLHHNFDQWRGTAPINHADHGIWVSGSGWLALHLWEHYQFSRDQRFLRDQAWPVMKEAALFYSDFLTEDSKTGFLISTPSNSPEHGGLVAGPTMDHQIIRSLFRACIETAGILKTDAAFADRLRSQVGRIAPDRIGQYGQLQEWMEDKDDPKDQHRHVSHLWGVYPGCEINWKDTPDLFAAARQSLVYRGDAATGWSMGWKVNLWARFLDGDHAYRILNNLLTPVAVSQGSGGMYPNLFDAHPPFQIDGNFGATAGMAELLLQSHLRDKEGFPILHFLPALPKAWPEGSFHGLCARGGFVVSAEWKNSRLLWAEISSSAGGSARLKVGDREEKVTLKAGQTKNWKLETGD